MIFAVRPFYSAPIRKVAIFHLVNMKSFHSGQY